MSEVTYPKGTMQELFDDNPSTWIRGSYARSKSLAVCGPLDAQAASWCLVGAAYKVYKTQDKVDKIVGLLKTKIPGDYSITSWNDFHATFEDIKKLVKELNI